METIFRSDYMNQLVARVHKISSSNAPAFITGENGTGKEHIANLLHSTSSRKDKPFVAINCAAMPKDLIEAELFGSVRGAYTGSVSDRQGLFRSAGEGTIFLDELGEMPLETQSKLLRVIQEKRVRAVGDTRDYPIQCRIVAATNRSIREALDTGKLRKDLYYRLAVITLHVTPLRTRLEDIDVLVHYFAEQFANEEQKNISITPAAIQYLRSQPWEGNVRELKNVIHRAVLFAESETLDVKDFQADLSVEEKPLNQHLPWHEPTTSASDESLIQYFTLHPAPLLKMEELVIIGALTACKGNVLEASEMLNIGRQTLYNKMAIFKLDSNEFRLKKFKYVPQPIKLVTKDTETSEVTPIAVALRTYMKEHMPKDKTMTRHEICEATQSMFKTNPISQSAFSSVSRFHLERVGADQYSVKSNVESGIVIDSRKSLTQPQTIASVGA